MHSSNGDLTVQTGSGPQIEVQGQLSGSFVRPSFSHRSTADGLSLNPECRVPGNCSLNLGIFAPAGLPVSVSDSFGELDASGLRGTVALSDNTGDLTASRLTGDLHLSDSFGTLTASGLAGSIRLDNNSGDISLTFSKVPRQVNVTDSFGSITLVLSAGSATYRVATRNSFGSTTVSVPRSPTAGNVITASNNSGDITITTQKGSAVTHPLPESHPS